MLREAPLRYGAGDRRQPDRRERSLSRALVTGAAGFIGSHLCERLLADGFTVCGVDSFSSHYDRRLKELNLGALVDAARFTLVEGDLNSLSLPELTAGADVVFHLAARPGVRDSWQDFDEYVQANIVATKALMDACVGTQARVIFASSSSVYGDAAELPVRESTPTRPISPYGASKVTTEMITGAYASSYGMQTIGLRYFTVYGPRQRPDMALTRFIDAASAGRPIAIFGDGLQKRDMTYVGDAVQATVAAAEQGTPGRVYNVGSNRPLALLEILERLGEVMGCKLDLRHEEAQLGDVRDTWASVELAQSELGYAPATGIEEGLRRQVEEAARRREAVGIS
jgi:UDP-glucuronate 4-epimerase